MAKSKKYRQRRQSNWSQGKGGFFFLFVLAGASLLAVPAVGMLVLAGMAPTLVAVFTDVGHDRVLRLNALASFNFAGVFPFALEIWNAGGSMAVLNDLFADAYTWVVMFGAAAAGLAVLFIAPGVAAAILQVIVNERVRRIDNMREHLLAEWGPALEDTSPSSPGDPA